jgi:hypothetical protein
MSKVLMILASVVLSAGTTWAKAAKTTVRPGDRNVARDNKTDCGRLNPGLLGENTNPPAKEASASAGAKKNGRQ